MAGAASKQFEGRVRAHQSGSRQAMHRHDEPRLVVFLAGVMREEAFEGVRHFEPGEFVFRPAFFAHANVAVCGHAAYAHLRVSIGALRRWVAKNGWRAGCGRVDLDQHLHGDDVLALARVQPYVPGEAQSDLEFAAALLRQEAPPHIGNVAMHLGLRPYDLTRRFKRAFGLSPNAYRRQARLQRAIQMLAESAGSLSQIAQAAGFCDQSHLSNELKRETGLAPAALRIA